MDNVDGIFKNILSMIAKNSEKNEKDLERLFGAIHIFKALFEYMDLVFSKLRILDPSEDKIKEIDKAI